MISTDGPKGKLASIEFSDLKKDGQKTAKNTKVTVQAILCWSEYYNGKWQAAKTSDVDRPVTIESIDQSSYNRSNYKLLTSEVDNLLKITIGAGK